MRTCKLVASIFVAVALLGACGNGTAENGLIAARGSGGAEGGSLMSGKEVRSATFSGDVDVTPPGADFAEGVSVRLLSKDDGLLCIAVHYRYGGAGALCRPADSMLSMATSTMGSRDGDDYFVGFVDESLDEVRLKGASEAKVVSTIDVDGLSGVRIVATPTDGTRISAVSGYADGRHVLERVYPELPPRH